jgi:tetratricopeptide (TPR) repeat protein
MNDMNPLLELKRLAAMVNKLPRTLQFSLVWVGMFGVLGLIYWPSLSYGPVVDDPAQISLVQGYHGISELWGADGCGLFRPVKNLAFYLFARDGDLFDLRLASLMLFAALGTVCFCFFARLLRPSWALFAALLVLLHPAQVATVAFPSAINNIFSVIFILLFCHASLGFLQDACVRWGSLLRLVLFGGLALVGYELGVAIVPLSVLLAFYCRKCAWRRGVALIALSLVLVLLYLLVRQQENVVGELTHVMIPPMARDLELFCSAPYYTFRHFMLAVLPLGQGGVFLVDDPRVAFTSRLPYWILLALAACIAFWRLERKHSRIALGFLFFVCAMVPLSNWLPLRNGPIANYYLLLPWCGGALMLGALLQCCQVYARSSFVFLIALSFLGASAVGSHYRVAWWESQYSIYEFSVRNHPDNWVAWNNWGVVQVGRSEFNGAMDAFDESISLAPWYVGPYENKIWLELLTGRNQEVLDLFEKRGERSSDGMNAAAAIAFQKTGNLQMAEAWARETSVDRLKAGQAKLFQRVMAR